MNIRDLPIYKKHYDANEPEEHAPISVEACISAFESFRDELLANTPRLG